MPTRGEAEPAVPIGEEASFRPLSLASSPRGSTLETNLNRSERSQGICISPNAPSVCLKLHHPSNICTPDVSVPIVYIHQP